MSLLSSTQGTPERVWSLVQAIAASGGSLDRDDAAKWLNPGFLKDGQVVAENPSAFAQVLGAASSLGAVSADGGRLNLTCPSEIKRFPDFCDWVHQVLASLNSTEKDAVLLETLAWVYVECDRQRSTLWIHDFTEDGFADAADAALPDGEDDDGQRRLNRTKLPSWRRWLLSLGLMSELPGGPRPHPLSDGRAARELARPEFRKGVEFLAKDFLAALGARLPYIDGGRMFAEAARRMSHSVAPERLSPILSATLRNLHDDGTIELVVRGDAGDLTRLSPDSAHAVDAFRAVIVKG